MSVDLWYGLMMKSASLLGDAANNSGDVFILGSSILVLSSTTAVKNRLALFKGIIMTVFGLWAFYHVYLGLIEESDLLTGGHFYYWSNVIGWQHKRCIHDVQAPAQRHKLHECIYLLQE